jgi:hypothetical protein
MEKSINNIQTMNKPENSKNSKEEQQMKQIQSYIVDLTQIDGNGEFLCPECGNRISPDDCTEEDYSILEIKMKTKNLDEVIIQCNKCAATIHLKGFSILQKLSRTETKKLKTQKEENDLCYVVHV